MIFKNYFGGVLTPKPPPLHQLRPTGATSARQTAAELASSMTSLSAAVTATAAGPAAAAAMVQTANSH